LAAFVRRHSLAVKLAAVRVTGLRTQGLALHEKKHLFDRFAGKNCKHSPRWLHRRDRFGILAGRYSQEYRVADFVCGKSRLVL
jgi:hypothetical protein